MSKNKDSQEVLVSPLSQIQSLLDSNPNDHFNRDDDSINNYKISTGSLKLDIEIGGGLEAGAHRFIGVREGGKTSASLEIARNFQNTLKEKGYIVYFKAEGRLSDDILTRAKIDTSENKFKVIKSNVYEFIIDTMKSLVANNPSEIKYMFIIDSIDGLITREELKKSAEEAAKVGSSAYMLSRLFKTLSLPLSENGHLAIFISQERSQIVINPYAPRAQTQGSSSGGNAIQHYVNFAFNFRQRSKDDLIFEDDDDKKDILGHWCKIQLLKTTNDNSNVEVKYPVKRKSGIWREYEVADICLEWEIFQKATAQIYALNVASGVDIVKELNEKFKDRVPEKIRGIKNYYDFFNDPKNSDIVDYLYNKFREKLCGSSR